MKKSIKYLEKDLPLFLQESIDKFIIGYNKYISEEKYYRFDCDCDELISSINVADVEDLISTEQANYLREKYLDRKFEWN